MEEVGSMGGGEVGSGVGWKWGRGRWGGKEWGRGGEGGRRWGVGGMKGGRVDWGEVGNRK